MPSSTPIPLTEDIQRSSATESNVAGQSTPSMSENNPNYQNATLERNSSEEISGDGNEAEVSTDKITHSTALQSATEVYATPVSDRSTPFNDVDSSSNSPKKRPGKKLKPKDRKRRQKEPQLRAGNTNEIILTLLKECHYGEKGEQLDGKHAQEVQTVADHMISDNCGQLLQSYVGKWQQNSAAGRHALALPTLNKDPAAAGRYFELFQWGDLPMQSLELRIAQCSFYVVYLEICRNLRNNKGDSVPKARTKGVKITTTAKDMILEASLGVPTQGLSQSEVDLHRASLANVFRWGKRWWTLASSIGLGVLIGCSDELASRM